MHVHVKKSCPIIETWLYTAMCVCLCSQGVGSKVDWLMVKSPKRDRCMLQLQLKNDKLFYMKTVDTAGQPHRFVVIWLLRNWYISKYGSAHPPSIYPGWNQLYKKRMTRLSNFAAYFILLSLTELKGFHFCGLLRKGFANIGSYLLKGVMVDKELHFPSASASVSS